MISVRNHVSNSSFQDPRYNILLMMATDRRDTYRLARDLGGKSLRLLRKQLQATWVRATIPSFMLRGFVTLTSFLQRVRSTVSLQRNLNSYSVCFYSRNRSNHWGMNFNRSKGNGSENLAEPCFPVFAARYFAISRGH